MRHSMPWWFVACAVLVMGMLVATSARVDGAEPSSSPLDPEFEREYRATLREIRRLQEEVGHLRARRPLEEVGAEEEPALEEPVEDLVPAIKIGQLSNFGNGLAWSVTVGWEFQPSANVEVAELGVWDVDGKGHSVDTPVGIFDLSGKEIASVTIPSGNTATLVDNFRYVKIDPVELRGGERYTILALYTPETKGGIVSGGGANISSAPAIRWLRPRYCKSDTLWPRDETWFVTSEELPGNIGPSFRLTPSAANRGPRHFYRVRTIDQPKKVVEVTPELADGSHLTEKIHTVSLYALPSGRLTQIMINDIPLGTGDEAYGSLVNELQQLGLDRPESREHVNFVAMQSIKVADLQRALRASEEGHYSPSDVGRGVNGTIAILSPGRMKQPERKGQFVDVDRFRDRGDYVEDRWTGLLWQKDGAASGKLNFYEARDYSADLELDGVRGWRLPKPDELATIFPATFAPFTSSMYNANRHRGGAEEEFSAYWTSQLDLPRKDKAFLYTWYADGGSSNGFASKNFAYVRCVRDPLEDRGESDESR